VCRLYLVVLAVIVVVLLFAPICCGAHWLHVIFPQELL
jgi:hypothetical protein